jgi:hypothetical protein
LTTPTEITATRIVRIANQSGRARLRTFSSPILAAPTMKNDEGFLEELDHYKCYRGYGRSANTVVALRDPFHEGGPAKIGEPTLYNPTRKQDAAGNLFGVKNAIAWPAIASPRSRSKQIVGVDQFGVQTRRVRNADLLCAPTAKLAWDRVG